MLARDPERPLAPVSERLIRYKPANVEVPVKSDLYNRVVLTIIAIARGSFEPLCRQQLVDFVHICKLYANGV